MFNSNITDSSLAVVQNYYAKLTRAEKQRLKKGKKPAGSKPATASKQPEPTKKTRDDKTLKAIGASTGEDVCSCIHVLAQYIKETIKLIFCAPDFKDCDTKFGEMFCEMGDITIRLFRDAYNFIRFLCKLIISSLRKPSR